MKHATKVQLIQVLLSGVVFLLLWWLLAALGARLVDLTEVQAWLAKKEWLSLANPDIRNRILANWQPLLALILAVTVFYPLLKNPAAALAKRFFLHAPPLTLAWDPPGDGLPQPEFLYFFPPGFSQVCLPTLKNNTADPIQIQRIELETHIIQTISNLGTERLTGGSSFPLRFTSDERDAENGLEWKKTAENTWLIDTPFSLASLGGRALPCPGLETDEENPTAETELNKWVGLANLSIEFSLCCQLETGPYTASLSAPLRVLFSLEQGGDGTIGLLISQLEVKTDAERQKLLQAYNRARRSDFQTRQLIAQRLNDMQAAKMLEEAQHAIALNPADPLLYLNLGNIHLGQGRCPEALSAFERAAQLGLDTPDLHLARATALLGNSQSEAALREIELALSVHPTEAGLHATKGRILVDLGRDEEALAEFKQAIQLDPTQLDAYLGQGWAYVKLDNLEEAQSSFERALQLDPNASLAHLGCALALSDTGQDGEVLAEIDQTLSLGYREVSILRSLGTLMEEESLPAFRQLLDRYDLLSEYDQVGVDASA